MYRRELFFESRVHILFYGGIPDQNPCFLYNLPLQSTKAQLETRPNNTCLLKHKAIFKIELERN